MSKSKDQIRQSQLITTFGPGSMVDLPDRAVLIAGLDFWSPGGDTIAEPRLSRKVASVLEVPLVELRSPPPADDDPSTRTGIQVFQFPEWFITQGLEKQDGAGVRTRLLVHRKALTRGRYIDLERRPRLVVPVRFVRACRHGHIGDVDWYAFVHEGAKDCPKRQLYMDERGTSGDLSEIWIRCDCKKERNMAQASQRQFKALGLCDGARPWLGPATREKCGETNRLLIRAASNVYFPQLMSVISLPDRDVAVRQAVDAVWDFLEAVEDLDDVRRERKKVRVKEALDGVSDEEALSEISSRRSGTAPDDKPIKVAELETLKAAKEEIGEDRPEGVFYARALPRAEWDRPWMKAIERVVLVHRLREVVAQVGFTRFESAAPDMEGELEIGVRRAVLASEISWVPAYENKGEGVFLQFCEKAIADWLKRGGDAVSMRSLQLAAGQKAWIAEHPGNKRKQPGPAFVMLHSFAHLLINTVALECGYPAGSIRERIYAVPEVGFGVLIYTGSSDSEGTLGGLVQAGRRIQESVWSALEAGKLCSNDPVCAQHDPASGHERRFLHGAACHGCLLISETSCEQQNDFLDRALVVPTVEGLGAEFFTEGAE